MLFEDFSTLSSGGQFVLWTRIIGQSLVEVLMRNICVKLLRIWASSSGGDFV